MLVNYSDLTRKDVKEGVSSFEILTPEQTRNGNAGLRLLELENDAWFEVNAEKIEICYYLLNGRGSIIFSKNKKQSRWVIEPDNAVWVSSGTDHTIINSGEGPFRCLVAYCNSNTVNPKLHQVRKISDIPTYEMIGFISRSIFDKKMLSILGASRCVGVDLETVTPFSLLNTHSHEEEILFVLRGKGFVKIENSEFRITPGSTVYTGPHVPHSVHNTSDDNLQYLVYEFAP